MVKACAANTYCSTHASLFSNWNILRNFTWVPYHISRVHVFLSLAFNILTTKQYQQYTTISQFEMEATNTEFDPIFYVDRIFKTSNGWLKVCKDHSVVWEKIWRYGGWFPPVQNQTLGGSRRKLSTASQDGVIKPHDWSNVMPPYCSVKNQSGRPWDQHYTSLFARHLLQPRQSKKLKSNK